MKALTKAEEQIMHILWELDKAFVKDIIERLPDPKPAYNTVSKLSEFWKRRDLLAIQPTVKLINTTLSFLKKIIPSFI